MKRTTANERQELLEQASMYYISDYIKKVSYYTMKYELTAGREILMSSEMAPTDDNQIVFEPE